MSTTAPRPTTPGQLPDYAPRQSGSRLKRFLGHAKMPYRIAPLLLALFLVPLICTYYNGDLSYTSTELLTQLVKNGVVFCLLAVGASIVLATGQIDLTSIGVAVLSGVMFAAVLSYDDHFSPIRVIFGLMLTGTFAVFSGVMVAYCFHKLKAPLLILTWALGSVYTVIAILATNLASNIAQHDVSGVWLPSMIFNGFWEVGHGGFILSVVSILVAMAIPEWSSLGDRARAIGANESSARYAGVPTLRTYYQAFIFNALLADSAGILSALYLNRASTADLPKKELIPIAIAVLGGTSLSGGYLYVPSVVLAAFFWTTVRLLGPQLPSIFPWLTSFQAELGDILFFTIFIGVSLLFGKLLMPPLQKVFARQEG